MKKILFAIPLLFLAGCGASPKKIDTLPLTQNSSSTPSVVEQKDAVGVVVSDPVTAASLDTLEKTSPLFVYDLPIANSVITKREVSGFLDNNKTGKITKVEIGMGELTEEYYFQKGEVFLVRVSTTFTVDGQASKDVKETTFENGKLVKYVKNGEVVSDTSNNAFLEEQGKTDAANLLEDFYQRKELNS